MLGFNILGLNIHNKDFHTKDAESQVQLILEGSEDSFNSFKEAKEYIDAAVAGAQGGSLADYIKTSVADGKYQAKGDYALKSELPSVDGLASESWVEGKGYITSSDIPASLPASDVSDWAKASSKPTYTAAEVGALPSSTVIPAAQVLSDWNATEGMGVILNKPEIYTEELVVNLYNILEQRITALESNPSSPSTTSKAYFAIIPGTTATYKSNLKSFAGDFTELTDKETIINSDDESGMIAVLYNNWIPEFSAYDENLQTWGTPIKLSSGSATTGYTKTVDGTEYVLWYSTSAVVSTNRQFKITLK